MSLFNCWEFKKCGREPDGKNVGTLGICPAASLVKADGYWGGKNGGRACVFIAGTFCSGVVQGTYQDKEKECIKCEFFHLMKKEHPDDFIVFTFDKYVNKKWEQVK